MFSNLKSLVGKIDPKEREIYFRIHERLKDVKFKYSEDIRTLYIPNFFNDNFKLDEKFLKKIRGRLVNIDLDIVKIRTNLFYSVVAPNNTDIEVSFIGAHIRAMEDIYKLLCVETPAGRICGKYAIALYNFLNKYREAGEVIATLEELRYELNIDEGKYKQYCSFKKQIIQAAQREFNERSDLGFKFEEIKVGRATGKLWFKLINLPY